MSGGYITPQNQYDHQVVTITFIGHVDEELASSWNKFLHELKRKYPKIASVTVVAQPTPHEFRAEHPERE